MRASITNTSKADQGVWTDEGLAFIKPGQTRTLTIAGDYVDRAKALPFLTIGDPVETPAGVPSLTDAEEIELIDAMTDPELRGFIERKTKKKPHHATGHDKLVALAKEAAAR